jgi:hypothetical protein
VALLYLQGAIIVIPHRRQYGFRKEQFWDMLHAHQHRIDGSVF